MTATYSMSAVQYDIERFLHAEAWLLDDLRFEDWERLLAPEVRYRIPIRSNVTDPKLTGANPSTFSSEDQLCHFDEDAESIRVRLTRLRSGSAWSEDPPSRTRRIIGNVVITPTDRETDFEVRSAFLLHRVRGDRDIELFAGERRDLLRSSDSDAGFQIINRLVLLDHALLHANDIGIFF